MNRPPRYVLDILDVLTKAGYDARIVGGSVRDLLLGRRPNDWDVSSSAPPGVVVNLFQNTLENGIRHGTVTVLCGKRAVEVTTFRAESSYSDHRRPDSVRFIGDIDGDLARRDFTVNAMAMRANGEIYDPFDGRADLKARVIRCVGDPETRFEEDALRMLRAYRFSAQLGFEIVPETEAAIAKCSALAASLSPERVRDELRKTLYSQNPETIGKMIEAGLLDAYIIRGNLCLSGLRKLPKYARMAHLSAELERAGCIMSTKSFLSALRFDGRTIEIASAASAILISGSRDLKPILRDYGLEAARAAFPGDRELRRILRSDECWRLADLAVSGDDLIALGYAGEEIGYALNRLLNHVIRYPQDNQKEILCKLAAR